MSKLGFRKFGNALEAIQPCFDTLGEVYDKYEHQARKLLISLCRDVVEEAEQHPEYENADYMTEEVEILMPEVGDDE